MSGSNGTNGHGTLAAAQKPSWEDRLASIKRHFPSAAEADWHDALGDVDLMGRLLRECIRVGHTPVRRGGRPMLEISEGEARLRQLLGDDYTALPFPEAFGALAGVRRSHEVAAATGISQSRCMRLLKGQVEPTGADMEAIARAFGKLPVWFLEYRIGLVVSWVVKYLEGAPEVTVGIVRRLAAGAGG